MFRFNLNSNQTKQIFYNKMILGHIISNEKDNKL